MRPLYSSRREFCPTEDHQVKRFVLGECCLEVDICEVGFFFRFVDFAIGVEFESNVLCLITIQKAEHHILYKRIHSRL
jgi:hypothetical protein